MQIIPDSRKRLFDRKKTDEPSHKGELMWLLLIMMGLAVAGIAYMAKREIIIKYDEYGRPLVPEERKKKLEKVLKELEGAEQYALRATDNGWYDCFSCKDTTAIFLFKGEVWKYGTSTKGPKRYSKRWMKIKRLDYDQQFEGTIEECLKEERRKIIEYIILPENLKRKKLLVRPPGNKRDF